MISPLEDFGTWADLALATVDTPSSFCDYISDFEFLISSIENTGKLPKPIEEQTEYFIAIVCKSLLKQVLQMKIIDKEFQNVYSKFFELMIRLNVNGLKQRNIQSLYIFEMMFPYESHPIFKNNHFLIEKTRSFLKKYKMQENIAEIIKDNNTNDDILTVFLKMINVISNFILEQPPEIICDILCVRIKKVLSKKNNKGKIIQLISNAKELLQKQHIFDKNSLIKWFEIIDRIIKMNDPQLLIVATNMILMFLSEPKSENVFIKSGILEFIRGPLPEGEYPLLSCLIRKLQNKNFVISLLSDMWETRTRRSPFEQQQFDNFFIDLASDFCPIKELTKVVLRNPPSKSHMSFLKDFAKKLGERSSAKHSKLPLSAQASFSTMPTLESFSAEPSTTDGCIKSAQAEIEELKDCLKMIRGLLADVAFSPSVFSGFARGIFAEILGIELDDKEVGHLFGALSKQPQIFIESMRYGLKNYQFSDRKLALSLIDYLLSTAISFPELRQGALGLFVDVLNASDIHPDDMRTEFLFKLHGDSVFYWVANLLADANFVGLDFVDRLLENQETAIADDSLVDFVHHLIDISNGSVTLLKSLPFRGADLLWKLSAMPGPQSDSYARLLCQIYASNDGIELSDDQVIDEFMTLWYDRFNGMANRPLMINILRRFIIEFEHNVDPEWFGFRRHYQGTKPTTIHVTVTGNILNNSVSFDLPEAICVGTLQQRVARHAGLDFTKFILRTPEHTVDLRLQLRDIGKGMISFIAESADLQLLHTRRVIPSMSIVRSPISLMMMDEIREGSVGAYEFMSIIPTLDSEVILAQNLPRINMDWKEYLSTSKPLLFEYRIGAMMGLSTNEYMEAIDGRGCIKYLNGVLAGGPLETALSVVRYYSLFMSDSLLTKHRQEIFQAGIQRIESVSFEARKDSFMNVRDFLLKVVQTSNEPIELPEGFDRYVRTYVTHPVSFIRSGMAPLFALLPIPMSFFSSMLNKTREYEVFKAAIPHITGFDSDIFNAVFTSIEQHWPSRHAALHLLEKFIYKRALSDLDSHRATSLLLEVFFSIHSNNPEKEGVSAAANCLAKLRNDVCYEHFHTLHQNRKGYSETELDGDVGDRSIEGSGLMNVGASSFINAVLQQIFGIPLLRAAIIQYEGDLHYMYSIKQLFAEMLLSSAKSQSPEQFINDWPGRPLDPTVTQDAAIFLSSLIDRLEKGLGSKLMNALLGGRLIVSFNNNNSKSHYQKEESFYVLKLKIRNCSNVQESLKNIETKAKDQPMFVKHVHVASGPPYLIVHLDRFEDNVISKLDSPLELAERLSAFGRDYHLSGVIAHNGSFGFGHYVSYVKDRSNGFWRLCDDEMVYESSLDEVLDLRATAYILFYDRADTEGSSTEASVSEQLANQIEDENMMRDDIRLFCSTPYLRLMTEFARSGDPRFASLSLQYFFDSLPYTKRAPQAGTFAGLLASLIPKEETLRKTLNECMERGTVGPVVLFSDHDEVREASVKIITAMSPDDFTAEAALEYFKVAQQCPPFFHSFNEYFKALTHITHGKAVFEAAKEKCWAGTLTFLVTRAFDGFIRSSNITDEQFWSSVDLTGLLDMIVVVTGHKIPKLLVEFLLKQRMLDKVMASKTASRPIVDLLRTIYPDCTGYVTEAIRLKKARWFDAFGLFMEYFVFANNTEDVIGLASKLGFLDDIKSLAAALVTMCHSVRVCRLIVDHMELLNLMMFDPCEEVRNAAATCISLILGVDIEGLPPSSPVMKEKIFENEEHTPLFSVSPNGSISDQSKENLIQNIQKLIPKSIELAGESLSKEFVLVTGTVLSDLLYLKDFVNNARPYTAEATEALRILADKELYLSDCSSFLKPVRTALSSDTFPYFLQLSRHILVELKMTDEAIDAFLEGFCFVHAFAQPHPATKCDGGTVMNVADVAIMSNKERVSEYVIRNFEDIASKAYIETVVIASKLELKLPLIDRMPPLKTLREMRADINYLVQKVLTYSTESQSPERLVPLLRLIKLSTENRRAIWTELRRGPLSFQRFVSIYERPGCFLDRGDRSQYLLDVAQHSSTDPKLGHMIADSTRNSPAAFNTLAPWLVGHHGCITQSLARCAVNMSDMMDAPDPQKVVAVVRACHAGNVNLAHFSVTMVAGLSTRLDICRLLLESGEFTESDASPVSKAIEVLKDVNPRALSSLKEKIEKTRKAAIESNLSDAKILADMLL